MTKVGELLDLAGLDKEVIKSVTEKLADEDVVLEGEEEMQDEIYSNIKAILKK